MNTILRVSGAIPALTLGLCLVSLDAQAFPSCLTTFQNTYSSPTADANCQVCHESVNGGSNFNPYGADLRASVQPGETFDCAVALGRVEGANSDTDNGNFSNLEEITAGTQPGWCVFEQGGTCLATTASPPGGLLDPNPGNQIPTADAGGPYDGEAGSTLIQFDGTGSNDPDNDPLTYIWDFGDGNTADGATPTHTYALADVYDVTLVVNDGTANSVPDVVTATIVDPVADVAPIANPGESYSGIPGQPVVFDGSASADPNGNALTYSWDFGDGSVGEGVSPSHTYDAAATYTATLQVYDGALFSDVVPVKVTIASPLEQSDGEVLYTNNCVGCHGNPWDEPAADETLPGLRRVAGARSCNIDGSIFGNSVFPTGVPDMDFLKTMGEAEIGALSEYLNSQDASGEQRYVATCAGCHGIDATGGRTHENVRGESAGEIREAIGDEGEMRYLACMTDSDIESVAGFLGGLDNDHDHDGISDDDDPDDDNDGVSDEDEYEDGTDPYDDDTDDDGLNDGDERDYDCDPLDHDSDDDDLDDGDEVRRGTDPKDRDTDHDGRSDGDEVKMGTNPLVAEANSDQGSGSGGGSTGALWLMLLALAGAWRRTARHSD